jgi:uncharacterized repeat protein (TIGR03803 family)
VNPGTVFRISPDGIFKTLYVFTGGSDGSLPNFGHGRLALGKDGNFYGITSLGGKGSGTNGYGTVFKITPSGSLTTLYSFSGEADGATPVTGLTVGSDNNLYGVTYFGGTGSGMNGNGTIFRITPAGSFTSLYAFNGNADGAWPDSPLCVGPNGSLFGMTQYGGNGLGENGDGVAYEISVSNLSLRGTVKQETNLGAPLAGAEIALTSGRLFSRTTLTDSSGWFEFAGLSVDQYTLTPKKPGFAFDPPTQTLTLNQDTDVPVFVALKTRIRITSTQFTFAVGSSFTIEGVLEDPKGKPIPGVLIGLEDSLIFQSRQIGATDSKGRFSVSYSSPATSQTGVFTLNFIADQGIPKSLVVVALASRAEMYPAEKLALTVGPIGEVNLLDPFTLAVSRKTLDSTLPLPSPNDLLLAGQKILSFSFEWLKQFGYEFVSNPVNRVALIGAVTCLPDPRIPQATRVLCPASVKYLAKEIPHVAFVAYLKSIIVQSSWSDEDKRRGLDWVELGDVVYSVLSLKPAEGLLDVASTIQSVTSWVVSHAELITDSNGRIIGLQVVVVSATGDTSAVVGYRRAPDLQIISPKSSGRNFSLSIQSVNTGSYTLESKAAITDAQWAPIQTVIGTGGSIILSDTNAASSIRFYRVRRD